MILLATLAGSLGALSRYFVSGLVQARSGVAFPAGTLTVNLAGAFAMGVVVGIDGLDSDLTLLIAGFLGGFTTFSTWMVESLRLGLHPSRGRGLMNIAATLVAGVTLAAAGYSLMS